MCVFVCRVPKDEDAFNEVFQKACYTTNIFRNRIKLETYNVSSQQLTGKSAMMQRRLILAETKNKQRKKSKSERHPAAHTPAAVDAVAATLNRNLVNYHLALVMRTELN